MEKIKTGLGYALTFAAAALHGYLSNKGVDQATSAAIVGPLWAIGARLLQQATPQGKISVPVSR